MSRHSAGQAPCTEAVLRQTRGALKAPQSCRSGTDLHEVTDEVLGDEADGLRLVPASGRCFWGSLHIPKDHDGAARPRLLQALQERTEFPTALLPPPRAQRSAPSSWAQRCSGHEGPRVPMSSGAFWHPLVPPSPVKAGHGKGFLPQQLRSPDEDTGRTKTTPTALVLL